MDGGGGGNKGPWGQRVHKYMFVYPFGSLEASLSFERTQILVKLAPRFQAFTPSVKRPLGPVSMKTSCPPDSSVHKYEPVQM